MFIQSYHTTHRHRIRFPITGSVNAAFEESAITRPNDKRDGRVEMAIASPEWLEMNGWKRNESVHWNILVMP